MKQAPLKLLFLGTFLTILVVGGCTGSGDKGVTHKDANYKEAEFKIQSKLIRLFPSDSPGQKADALILKSIFEHEFPVELIETNGDANGHDGLTPPSELGKTLVNIFIEHVYDIKTTKHAKFNWLSINQEYVDAPDRLANIDVVLCKTKLGTRLMLNYAKKYNMKFKVYYTKFTSLADVNENEKKDFNLAVHLAGKSPYKSTALVMETWIKNKSFPKLIVTCRALTPGSPGGCLPQQGLPILNKYKIPLVHEEAHASPNLEFYAGFLDQDRLTKWQDSAGYFITPSSTEGYGHYINEGRAHGAVVVTSDAPPMNELVEDGVSGFLVPIAGSAVINEYTEAREYTVDGAGFEQVLKRVFALTEQQKLAIGKRSRQAFLDDKKFFEDRMKVLADSLANHGDLSAVPENTYADLSRGQPKPDLQKK